MEHGERKAKKHWVAAVIEDVFRLFVFVCFGIGLPLELLQIMLVEERPGGSLYVLKNPELSLEKEYLFLLFFVLGVCHVFLVGWFTYSSKQSKMQLIPFRKRKSEDGISMCSCVLSPQTPTPRPVCADFPLFATERRKFALKKRQRE